MPEEPKTPLPRIIIHLDGGLVQAVYTHGLAGREAFPADVVVMDTDDVSDDEASAITHRFDPQFPGSGAARLAAYIHWETVEPLPDDSDLGYLLRTYDQECQKEVQQPG